MPTFVLILLGCCVLLVRGFLPSQESTDGRQDYTHASITQAAIYRASSDVIANVISPGKYNASDPDTTLTTYFDHDALVHFAQTIVDIVNKNNLAQRTYRDDASRTMNCEQIVSGHLLLQTLRDKIIHQSQTANPNWDAVRDLIGQYLFTLQEFYSNTNWVEMFGDRVCQELGISGESLPYKVSDHDKVTCTSCNYTKEAVQQYSCVDNMRSDGQLLTSGYTSYQSINKPIGQFPPNMGKCSHGGPYDDSKDIPATGGINKETSSPELSPHFDLHQPAGEAAIQATYDFFVGNGTGLLSVLGIEKFKEVMGMNYKNPCYNCLAPGLSVVFVIDDTGSMSGEIQQATQHSIDIVNQAKLLGSNGPSNFILSTFNDPGSKLLISISVTGLSPSARVTHIILKKPNGVILTKLPVSDTSRGSNRVLYAYYDVTPEDFFVSINGSIGTNIFTREKSDIVKPVTGEITFTSKPENLVLGENSVIDVAVKNTGSTSQTYQLTATSVPSGFPTQRSYSVTVGPRSSKTISLTLTPTNVSVATISVKLTLGGQTLQTITQTLMVVDVPPPKFSEVNRTSNCRREMLNYYNCTKQNWTLVLDVAFRASFKQLYVTPTTVQLKYARNSPSVYVATLSGTCCTYKSQMTAIDARGNMKTKTIDFLGVNVFNTTVENFDILTKPVPVKVKKTDLV